MLLYLRKENNSTIKGHCSELPKFNVLTNNLLCITKPSYLLFRPVVQSYDCYGYKVIQRAIINTIDHELSDCVNYKSEWSAYAALQPSQHSGPLLV